VRLDAIRQNVNGQIETAAPGNRDLWRITQAVDELTSNCMRHAYGLGVPGGIRVDVETGGQKIQIVVEDTGRPFTGSLEKPLDLGPSMEGRFGGLGLALTRMLVNELRYERVGALNRWTVVLDLSNPPRSERTTVPA